MDPADGSLVRVDEQHVVERIGRRSPADRTRILANPRDHRLTERQIPDAWRSNYVLADWHARVGRYEEAIAGYDRAESLYGMPAGGDSQELRERLLARNFLPNPRTSTVGADMDGDHEMED